MDAEEDNSGDMEQSQLIPRSCRISFMDNILRTKTFEDDVRLDTPLRRCLTTLELSLLGIGATLGTATYVITGNVMSTIAGPTTFICYIIAGIASMFSALCFAEFGAQIPKAGSSYTYAYVVAGEFWAFVAGWNVILEYLLGLASVAKAWSGSLDSLTNGSISNWENNSLAIIEGEMLNSRPDLIAFGVIILASAFISIGVTPSVVTTSILTVINLCFVAMTCTMSFYFANYHFFLEDHTGGAFPFGFKGILSGAATCFYAFYGFDSITVASEEAINPTKSIPRAIFITITVATTVYVTSALALALLVPYYGINTSSAFPSAFASKGITWASYLLGAASIFSISASLLVTSYTLPRIVYAMACDGLFFKIFAIVDSRSQIPLAAVAISSIVAGLLAIFFQLEVLTKFLSLGILISYTIVAVSILIYRYSPKDFHHDESTQHISMKKSSNENIGCLKPKYKYLPILNDCAPGLAVTVAIISLLVFSICLWVLVLETQEKRKLTQWWVYLFFVILIMGVILSVLVMWVHEAKTMDINSFKVPLVPFTPVMSILCNTYLMTQLSVATWLRLAVWMIIGFLIYFLYGVSHSVEGRKQREAQEFLKFPVDERLGTSTMKLQQPPNRDYQENILTKREKQARE